MIIGELEIKNDKVYVDGKFTSNPTLIGLAILDAIEDKPKHINFESTKNMLIAYIKEHKHRQTPERLELLKVIHEIDSFNAEDLYNLMKNRGYAVCRATIYNAIDLFVKSNIIKRNVLVEDKVNYPSVKFELNPVLLA